jgi:hypothetical protein
MPEPNDAQEAAPSLPSETAEEHPDKDPGAPPAEPSEPASRRLSRMWKAVTSALGLFFLGWIAPHYAPGLADAISARIHPDPIEWSLENLGSGSVVLPRPVSDPRSLPSGEEKAADLTSRLYAQGAADADTNHIVLTAKVARDASVVFKRLVIRNVERRPALRTPELVYAGGYTDEITVRIDLDKDPPTVLYSGRNRSPSRHLTLALSKGETVLFDIYAFSRKHLTTWEGELQLSVNGKDRTFALNRDGHPFAVSPVRPNGKLLYPKRPVYAWDGDGWIRLR